MQTEAEHSRYANAGLTSDGVRPSSIHLFNKIMQGIAVLAFCTHAVFLVVFWLFDVSMLALFNFFSIGLYACTYYLSKKKKPLLAWVITMVEVIAHAVLATLLLGWNTSFHLLIVLTLPVLCFGYQPLWRQKVPIGVVVVALYLWLDFNYRNVAPPHMLPANFTEALHYLNLGIFLFMLSFLCGLYEHIVRLSEEKLSKYATTDGLTQLKNRRAAIACAEIELARQRRTDEPLTFVLCDIDHFKKVNDTLGHEAGDRVLRAVAEALTQGVRVTDHLSRYGGEEFLLILPNTSSKNSYLVLERIRKNIENKIYESAQLAGIDLSNTPVTMTFGMFTQKAGDAFANVDQIIDCADQNLYKGKRDGRNRIVGSESA